MSKMDWRGFDDTTPASSPKSDPRDYGDGSSSKGDSWKGYADTTPPSKPAAPNK